MADFETPELRKIPVVPKIKPGATSHLSPHVAKPAIQKPLGYPGELVDNWEQVAIDKLGELKGKYRSLQVFLDAQRLQALLHSGRQMVPEMGGCPGHDQGGFGRVVQLLSSVFRVPAMLCVLPVRHRHRGDSDGCPRDHGFGGQGTEVL